MSGAGTDNLQAAIFLIENLRAWGVVTFVVCPGARSSPLAAALYEAAEAAPHFDERGAAFYALGRAKAASQPAVVITTSGTAVANLHPAAVEALHAEVPLIFLTADRPSRLRGTGANQTIDQRGIFGPSVKWWGTLAEGADRVALSKSVLETAWREAMAPPRGPVHINCPFDEPLLPDEWRRNQAGLPLPAPPIPSSPIAPEGGCCVPRGPGVVVVGQLSVQEQGQAEEILDLAERLGWPVFADALSGVPCRPPVIPHAPFLMGSFRDWPTPTGVILLGQSVVSKAVGLYASAARAEACLQVSASPRARDPWGQAPRKITMPVREFCRQAVIPYPAPPDWLETWQEAGREAAAFLDRELSTSCLSEMAIARNLAEILPEGWNLFLGNSLPVRHFDLYARWIGGLRRVHGNRGASGIDGCVATACGLAETAPTLAFLGDLAVLHDASSLALAAQRRPPLVIVALNNGGGGIFRFVPKPGFSLGQLWETPHDFSLADIAASFGWKTACPATLPEFRETLASALQGPFPALVEARTQPSETWSLHRRLSQGIHDKMEAAAKRLRLVARKLV